MRIMVIGLDRGSSDVLFEDARLSNIRHLKSFACFGQLESAGELQNGLEWICVAASQERADGESPKGVTIWEQIAKQGKEAIVVLVPPGITYPGKILEVFNEEFEEEPAESVDIEQIKEHVYLQSRREFDFVRHLMRSETWDYFQFVDTGLERLYRESEAGSIKVNQETIRDYHLYFDDQIGAIFELLDEDTIVLVLAAPSELLPVGSFILAGASLSASGLVEGVHPLDLAPTLLELGGYEIPGTMQGKPLMARAQADTELGLPEEEEAILRERLSGLGYF